MGTKEEVRVLLAKVEHASHGRAQQAELEGVGHGSSHEGALLEGLIEAIEEVAVAAAGSLGVHLIDLHSVEDDVDGVGQETGDGTSRNAGVKEFVKAGHATGVLVDLVVEVAESPDSCSCITHSSQKEGIEGGVELSEAAT